MNQSSSKLYPDIVFQCLVFVPMMLCYFLAIIEPTFLIGALLIKLGVGAVQLLSGLFYAVTRKSRWHTTYFVSAILYLLFIIVLLTGIGNAGNTSETLFFICFGLFSGLIPVGISIWYLTKSLTYHKTYMEPRKDQPYGDEELLDDFFQIER